jgi:putative phosphoribosyl transferase
MENKIFKHREDALKKLALVLPLDEMLQEDWIVIATSAGAVPIAFGLSKKLNSDFDFIFTQKINTPKNNECEIAIITETNDIIIHEELMKSFDIKLDDIYQKANKKYNEDMQEYKQKYREGKDIIYMKGKNILLVDEGLNTGLTMMACIKSIINKNVKSICVAVPILPNITIQDIETIADDLYYVKAPEHFISIDYYYDELEDIEIDDINKIKINLKEKNGNDM